MPNPFDPTYLTEASPTFGPFAWIFYAVQALCIAAGVYFSFAWKERNALRMRMVRRLGMVLIALGSMGTLLGVLRLRDIAPFNQRYWFYLMLLADLLLAASVVYYARVISPRQQAQTSRRTGREKGSRPQTSRLSAGGATEGSTNGTEEPELSPGRSRREARQRRKRKKRS